MRSVLNFTSFCLRQSGAIFHRSGESSCNGTKLRSCPQLGRPVLILFEQSIFNLVPDQSSFFIKINKMIATENLVTDFQGKKSLVYCL